MNINSQEWIDSKIVHLTQGDMEISGRLVDASNATLFGSITQNDISMDVIYKPIAGERPLWDFPDGTLADREYAAFLLSRLSGLNLIPPTVLRDGPAGIGMVQLWIDVDQSINLASFFSQDDLRLRRLALFDACINNTDRKIGHLLPDNQGNLFACDHGVTFHVEDKLRTVLWQWAGDDLTSDELVLLSRLEQVIKNDRQRFAPHLTDEELDALVFRIQRLMETGTMPLPSQDWPAIPWPAY
ncbi:MAG: SCO1664 family protein [Candidatus Planktophila sp.]